MGPNQSYKFLHSKETIKKKNEKTTYKMGENICKQCDPPWLNLPNIQIAYKTQQQQKASNPIKKWVETPNRLFLKGGIDGQHACEKMLNITTYQRNANQHYNEVPSHTS